MKSSENKYLIRNATPDDAADIYRLIVELAIYEKSRDQVTTTVEIYRSYLAEGRIAAKVAVIEDKIIGIALFYETFSTWRGLMYYLEDFIVTDQYRRQGIGDALMAAFIEEANRAGAALVKWQVLDWNKPAINFYKKMGCIIEDEWWNVKMLLNIPK